MVCGRGVTLHSEQLWTPAGDREWPATGLGRGVALLQAGDDAGAL